MSLTKQQEENTRRELRENFNKAGVSLQQAAEDLGTSEEYIVELLGLKPKYLEDTWILRNYLLEKAAEAGETPTPFTALGADYHIIPFLNSDYIDGKKIMERPDGARLRR